MKVEALVFLVLLCLADSTLAASAIDAYAFEDPAVEARYHALIAELRCPKCLNTNIAGSDAPIAKDLRREVYEQLKGGRSDAEVRTFLQARYGDFVLYDPPLRADTVVLWAGPALLLVLGVVLIIRISRQRAGRAGAELADPDRERLQHLLERGTGPGDEA